MAPPTSKSVIGIPPGPVGGGATTVELLFAVLVIPVELLRVAVALPDEFESAVEFVPVMTPTKVHEELVLAVEECDWVCDCEVQQLVVVALLLVVEDDLAVEDEDEEPQPAPKTVPEAGMMTSTKPFDSSVA